MIRGFPRPFSKSKKLPVPYTQGSTGGSLFGWQRTSLVDECLNDELCVVCGLKLDDTCSIAVTTKDGVMLTKDRMEGQAHNKCARMTEVMCPAFDTTAWEYVHDVPTGVVSKLNQGEAMTKEELYEARVGNMTDNFEDRARAEAERQCYDEYDIVTWMDGAQWARGQGPTEAQVEAAARAMSQHWRDMHTNESLGYQRMLARYALLAAKEAE